MMRDSEDSASEDGAPEIQRLSEQFFLEALEFDPGTDRQEFLGQRCDGLPDAVLAGVEKLLAADQRAEDLGLTRLARLSDSTQGHSSQYIGQEIGPYKLLQVLGEGGMGTVFMAEQTKPIQRKVAVKIVKPGMMSKEALARFDAERQALALMDHPNIAKVLDAGKTEDGQPYFVMELVRGIPITEYCDQHKLDTRRRLELFLCVCHAVAHAHQKGIIHRDIKPNNVMVAEYDDEAIPKVIDFGVAKAIAQKLTDKTMFTRFGQLVGTFEYMSPEQAKLNQLDIDTRSDVYSLGVLLYELLTGTTPFDRQRLRSAALDELVRIICEEDPPRPSTRLTSNKTSSDIAEKRGGKPPATLSKLLRGELDWVVMLSLEKDRRRRYQSVGNLADDILCYLNGEAVEACPPTFFYRLRKLVKQYRTQAAILMAVVVALCASALLGWILFRQTKVGYDQLVAQAKLGEAAMMDVARSKDLLSTHPVQSTRAAIDAVEKSRDLEGSLLQLARKTLWNSTSRIGSEEFRLPAGGPDPLDQIKISHQGKWILARSGKMHRAFRRGPAGFDKIVDMAHTEKHNRKVAISKDERFCVTSDSERVLLWDLNAPNPSDSTIVLHELPPNDDNPIAKHVAFSDDGHWLVQSYYKVGIFVWDLTADKPQETLRKLSGHEGGRHVRFDINADGSKLVTATQDGRCYLWDLNTDSDEPLHTFESLQGSDVGPTIDAAGRWLVTTLGGSTLLWDLSGKSSTWSPIELKRQGGNWGVHLARDGQRLALGGQDGSCCIYDLTVEDPRESCVMLKGHNTRIQVRVSADGRWLATGDFTGIVRLWDLNVIDSQASVTLIDERGARAKLWSAESAPQYSFVLSGHDSQIDGLVFNPDSTTLFSLDQSGMIRRWTPQAMNPSSESTIPINTRVQAAATSPDGKWLAVGCQGPESLLVELNGTAPFARKLYLSGALDGLGTIAISADSRWLIGSSARRVFEGEGSFGRNEKVAHVWDLKSTNPERIAFRLEGHADAVTSIAISRDTNRVVTGSLDGTVRIWSLNDEVAAEIHRLLAGHRERTDVAITDVAVSADGNIVVAACDSGPALVWNLGSELRTAEPLKLGDFNDDVLQVAVSPDGRWVAAGGSYELSYVWDLRAPPNYNQQELPGHKWASSFVTQLEFSRDGRWMASGSWDQMTNIFDMRRKNPYAAPYFSVRNDEFVLNQQFSQDGNLFISPSYVIDLRQAKQKALLNLPRPSGGVVALTTDNRFAIDTTTGVTAWHLDLDELLEKAKRLVGN